MRTLLAFKFRRGLLTLDQLTQIYDRQEGKCAISKIPMTHICGKGHVPTNISIDRIDNSGGYQADNVRLVCHVFNRMRSDLSAEEFVSYCRIVAQANQEP
jgi:hypothetical protein